MSRALFSPGCWMVEDLGGGPQQDGTGWKEQSLLGQGLEVISQKDKSEHRFERGRWNLVEKELSSMVRRL